MPIVHEPKSQQTHLERGETILTIEGLHYSYPDGHVALRGVSLQLENCEKAALVGPNGSGKSTLLLHINGLLNGEGEITVGGTQVVEENLPIIRGRVGLVFQNPDDQLFSPTVGEDVAFGPLHMGLPEDVVRQRVKDALAQVSMSDYAERLSYHLSMGEKKRIAVATVLSMQPELLALDEPSAGLDPRARRQLINLLADLPISMLVATHDLLMVRELFPRMIVLDQGELVADGATADILKDQALLEKHGLELP
jgi:cobalt/nickel transport system ATP-binding protein